MAGYEVQRVIVLVIRMMVILRMLEHLQVLLILLSYLNL
jgi:hypothetical protein